MEKSENRKVKEAIESIDSARIKKTATKEKATRIVQGCGRITRSGGRGRYCSSSRG